MTDAPAEQPAGTPDADGMVEVQPGQELIPADPKAMVAASRKDAPKPTADEVAANNAARAAQRRIAESRQVDSGDVASLVAAEVAKAEQRSGVQIATLEVMLENGFASDDRELFATCQTAEEVHRLAAKLNARDERLAAKFNEHYQAQAGAATNAAPVTQPKAPVSKPAPNGTGEIKEGMKFADMIATLKQNHPGSH